MTTLKSDAEVLYGGNTPAPSTPRGTALTPQGAPVLPAPPRSSNVIDADLYGTDYEPPPLGSGASDGEVLYRVPVTMRPALRQQQDTLADLGMGHEARIAFNRAHVETAHRTGLDPYVVGGPLLEAHVGALVAEKRGTELDTAQLVEQEETFRRELRGQYGRDRAEKLLDAAAAFVA